MDDEENYNNDYSSDESSDNDSDISSESSDTDSEDVYSDSEQLVVEFEPDTNDGITEDGTDGNITEPESGDEDDTFPDDDDNNEIIEPHPGEALSPFAEVPQPTIDRRPIPQDKWSKVISEEELTDLLTKGSTEDSYRYQLRCRFVNYMRTNKLRIFGQREPTDTMLNNIAEAILAYLQGTRSDENQTNKIKEILKRF